MTRFHWFKANDRVSLALALCFLSLAFPISAQTDVQPGTALISVDVNLVVLHATVRDRKGGFASDLRKEDFRVFENGVLQKIGVFQHEDVPVAVGLIVDNSGSMRRKQKDVAAAAMAFVKSSNPKDEMFIVNFNERVSYGLPNTKLFSAKPADLESALNGVPANGRTALYDALDTGFAHLKQANLDKKVLIAISDGGDNASHTTLAQVLATAGRSNAIVYTIGLFDEYDKDRNPGVLSKIARATGGEMFLPRESSKVVEVCERIAGDIRNQYMLGYAPTNQKLDNSYRTIKVVVAGRRGARLQVRARAGYIAAPRQDVRPQ
jgi:Ca-activated chloride channel family protein